MRRFLTPMVLVAALLAALALAASASAEVRVGEATRRPTPGIPPEDAVIGAHAQYDSSTGAVVFSVTTVAEPLSVNEEGEESEAQLVTVLFNSSTCKKLTLARSILPLLFVKVSYAEGARAFWELVETEDFIPEAPETEGPATKVVAGTTTTLSMAAAPKVANLEFNCAATAVSDPAWPGEEEPLVFPITAPPPPAPPAETTTTTTPPAQSQNVAPPGPAPAALAIAKAKPLKLKPGRWTTVKVKVTNTGGSASEPGSLRIKAPKGVALKPETQRLPALPSGGSWTVSARVRLTEKAKTKSTLALTAGAGKAVAKGAFVLERQD